MKRRLVLVAGAVLLAAGGAWLLFGHDRGTPAPRPPTASAPDPETDRTPESTPARAGARIALPPAPHEAAPPAGRIAGRVVDGLHNPLRGCEVAAQVVAPRVSIATPAADASEVHKVYSGEDGRFELGVPSGVELVVTLLHRDFPPNVHATDLVVQQDQRRELGDLVLRSEAGLVVLVLAQENELPVAGARLELAPPLDDAMLPGYPLAAARRSAVSDERGKAVFYGVAAGQYRLRVTAALRATRELDHAQPQDQAAGAPLVVRLGRGVTVRGRVLDGGDRPVAAARVTAIPSFPAPIESAATAADGAFRLTGLEAGRYRVEVESALFGRLAVDDVAAEDNREALELRYPRGAAITGRVVAAASGAPIAQATVRIAADPGAADDTGGARAGPKATTAASGWFELGGLPDRELALEVAAPGYVSVVAARQRPGGPPLELQLDVAGRIRGRVVDGSRRAIAGAQVELIDAAHDGSAFADFLRRVATAHLPGTRSGGDGAFELGGFASGSFRVRVLAAGLPAFATAPLQLDARRDLDLGAVTLEPGGQVLGIVRDPSGAPAIATISLEPVPGAQWRAALATRSRAGGNFDLGPVAPGEYELSCQSEPAPAAEAAASRASTRQRILVEAGRTQALELRLDPR